MQATGFLPEQDRRDERDSICNWIHQTSFIGPQIPLHGYSWDQLARKQLQQLRKQLCSDLADRIDEYSREAAHWLQARHQITKKRDAEICSFLHQLQLTKVPANCVRARDPSTLQGEPKACIVILEIP